MEKSIGLKRVNLFNSYTYRILNGQIIKEGLIGLFQT